MVIWAIGMDVHKDTCTARILCGEYGKSSKRIDDFIESFDTKFRRFPSGASEFLENLLSESPEHRFSSDTTRT